MRLNSAESRVVGRTYVAGLGMVPSLPAAQVEPGMLYVTRNGDYPIAQVRRDGRWVMITYDTPAGFQTRRCRPGTAVAVTGPTWVSRHGVRIRVEPDTYPRAGRWVIRVQEPGHPDHVIAAETYQAAVQAAWKLLVGE